MSIKRFTAVLSCAAGAALFNPSAADAAPVQYIIDPTRSTLSITGSFGGGSPSPQTAGSTSTRFSGTIDADKTDSTIQILLSSRMDAAPQAQNQSPAPDGDFFSSAQADYGRQGTVTTVFGSFDGVEAFRDVLLDLDSSALAISGNSFNSDFGLGLQSGTSDWAYGGSAFGSANLGGLSTSSFSPTDSLVETIGGIEQLTLRINTGPIGYQGAGSEISTIGFTGTIVATRVIPEPTSLAALAAGAGLLLVRRRH